MEDEEETQEEIEEEPMEEDIEEEPEEEKKFQKLEETPTARDLDDKPLSVNEIASILSNVSESTEKQKIINLYEDGIKNQNLERWFIYCSGMYNQAYTGIMRDLKSYEWYSNNGKKERFMNGIDDLLKSIVEYPNIMDSIVSLGEYNTTASKNATRASVLLAQTEIYEEKMAKLIDLLRASRSIYYHYSEYLKDQRNKLIEALGTIQKKVDETRNIVEIEL